MHRDGRSSALRGQLRLRTFGTHGKCGSVRRLHLEGNRQSVAGISPRRQSGPQHCSALPSINTLRCLPQLTPSRSESQENECICSALLDSAYLLPFPAQPLSRAPLLFTQG